MSDEPALIVVDRYAVRAATDEDLRTLWRAANQLETFAEFK